MSNEEWLKQRIAYIRELNKPTVQQELLLLLNDKTDRSADDKKKLSALIKAERADERAQAAKTEVRRIMDAEKRAARKARDHELYNSAGLLIVAGLVDSKTGKPKIDKAELVGALAGLAKLPEHHEKRTEWREEGERILAGHRG